MEPDNVIRFEEPVDQGGSVPVQVTFKDHNGANVNPATAKWSLYDVATNAVINTRTDVDVPGDTAIRIIELTPADNVILNNSLEKEEHRIRLVYTYGTNPVRTVPRDIQIVVVNLAEFA